jgi:AcrR family transcriptional regulator
MSPRPDVSEERKSQILQAAIAVFARRGFHQARMEDIADEAGLSKAALYLYYKSKDTVIAALLKFFFAQETQRLRKLVAAEGDETVSTLLVSMTERLAADLQWLARLIPVAFEFYAIAARQKDVRQFLKEYFQDYRELLAVLIQRGIERGEFRQVDASAVAITLCALYEGLVLLWMVDSQTVRFEQEGKAAVEMVLAGIHL